MNKLNTTEKFEKLDFYKKIALLKELAGMIHILGSDPVSNTGSVRYEDTYIHIMLYKGRDMNKVKAILRNYFNIEYRIRHNAICYDENKKMKLINHRYASADDVRRLCRIFLNYNIENVKYFNRFYTAKDTIAKMVYQYGEARYDLL
jgi:hypothetical protein